MGRVAHGQPGVIRPQGILLHQVAFVGKPGEVVDILLVEVEGLGGAFAGLSEFPLLELLEQLPPGALVGFVIRRFEGIILGGHLSQTVQKSVFGVPGRQVPRGHDDIFTGEGDAHIEGAEFAVELPHIQVGHGVPALRVVDRRLGVPLGDLVVIFRPPQAAEHLRDLHPERGFNRHRLTGWQGPGQAYLGHIYPLRMVLPAQGLPVNPEVQAVYAPPGLLPGEMELRTAKVELLPGKGGFVVPVGIGPQVEPDEVQGIGRIVRVVQRHEGRQQMVPVVEGDIDAGCQLLLEIALRPAELGAGCPYCGHKGKEKYGGHMAQALCHGGSILLRENLPWACWDAL